MTRWKITLRCRYSIMARLGLFFIAAAVFLSSPWVLSDGPGGPVGGTGHFTGSLKPSLGTYISDIFDRDQSYCSPLTEIVSGCEQPVQQSSTALLITDAERVVSAFNFSDLFHVHGPEKDVSDYEQVMGIPADKPLYKIGPQDINVTTAVDSDFASLSPADKGKAKAFYDSLDESAKKFKVLWKGPNGKISSIPIAQYPNFFLGDKISNVLDENGKPLEPGWLWQKALTFVGGDPVKAMRFLAYRGVEPEQRIARTDNTIALNHGDQQTANSPDSIWIALPQSLSSAASIPDDLELKLIAAHPNPDGHHATVNKNYHIFSSAYIGCILASRGHSVDEIVKVEAAFSDAYRDFTFRNEVCSQAHIPAPQNAMSSIASDDAIDLMGQLKRDSTSTDSKMNSLKNNREWPTDRYDKAKALVLQYLLDWDWTRAQHEAGARWGAETCKKN